MAISPPPPGTALVLDNDVMNDWRFQRPHTVRAIHGYIAVHKTLPALTAITVFEALHGFEKTAFDRGGMDERTRAGLEATKDLIDACPDVLEYNRTAAEITAYIFPRLTRKQHKDHWADVLVAATAMAHRYGVATRNRRHFELINERRPPHLSNLSIEVWGG